ncbi:hypothetical protein [Virgibacillus sp. DJP39]|uniref:hypothetical protein n=1 Tax=Virgibacillus sp. DJP39 TaxID=3409790 RepID=UPI003BB6DF07
MLKEKVSKLPDIAISNEYEGFLFKVRDNLLCFLTKDNECLKNDIYFLLSEDGKENKNGIYLKLDDSFPLLFKEIKQRIKEEGNSVLDEYVEGNGINGMLDNAINEIRKNELMV